MKKDRSGHCIKCGVYREILHRDHIVPKWMGGSDEESNIQYLCANCHQDKCLAETRSEAFRTWRSEDNKKRYEDPAERKKIRDAWTPEKRAKRSEQERKRFEDPSERARAGAKSVGIKWDAERRKAHGIRQTGLVRPRKKGFIPLSVEHAAAAKEGRRRRHEFLASLTPAQRLEFDIQENKKKLEKLHLQMARQAELSSEKETVN